MSAKNRTENSKYLDTKTASAYLGFAEMTLKIWRMKGIGPAHHVVNRSVRYDRADLDAFMAAHKVGAHG